MTPVFQDHLDEEGTGPGNCMQAAVASLLDLPLKRVPNFIETADPDGQMQLFLTAYGLRLVRKPAAFVPVGIYLQTGLSTQGHEHIVICRHGRVIHDPNPHGRGLVKPDGVLWPQPFTKRAQSYVS